MHQPEQLCSASNIHTYITNSAWNLFVSVFSCFAKLTFLFLSYLLQVQIWNTAVNVSVFYDKYLKGTEQGLVRYYK